MSSDLSLNEIIIPINDSTNANDSFSKKTLIQINSYIKAEHIIKENLLGSKKELEQIKDNPKKINRFHEAITILGERGSGKTSFLLNLENILKKDFGDKLSFLQILDPTLFENKQHVMLTIISIIINKVEELSSENKVNTEKEKDYKNSLNKLAEGINLLDGIDSEINHKSIWEDARINFNKGISFSKTGISFENDFKSFISKTLEYINKEMFILIFDDIDTNIEKGWPVLEVIRKYLTTLQLQVIVSGDWSLFSKLVRVNQFKNLNGLEKIEEQCKCEERYEYLKTLDTLEEQYLTKILKPENRIMLQNLQSINRNKSIYIIEDNKMLEDYIPDEKDQLDTIYLEIMYELLNTKREENFETLKKIFLTLPLRSNIQLVYSYFKIKNKNKEEKGNYIDTVGKQFLTQLSRFNITYQDFAEFKEDTAVYYYIKKALEIVTNNNIDFDTLLNLATLPVTENEDRNMLFFILKSFMSTTIMSKPHLAIEWMYKIELYSLLRLNDDYNYENVITLKDDLTYLGHGKSTSSHEFIVRLNGYLQYQEDDKKDRIISNLPGFIKVYKDSSKMGDISYDYFLTQVKKLENAEFYGLLSRIMFNEIKVKRESETHLFGSIHFIIGFIADMIKGYKQAQTMSKLLHNKAVKTSIRPYADNYIDSVINYGKLLDKKNYENCTLVTGLDSWLKKLDNLKSFPLETLENTIKEFYYLESEIPNTDNFGDHLLLQTVYFLNALLKADLKNIKNEDTNILRIKQIKEAFKRLDMNIKNSKINILNDSELSLFSFIYQCPLWEYLIGLHSNSFIYTLKEKTPSRPSSLFDEYEEDNDNEDKNSEEINVTENKFFRLLQGIKKHGSNITKEKHENNNEEINKEFKHQEESTDFEKEHSVKKYIELFIKEKEKLSTISIPSIDDITENTIDLFIDSIRSYYKKDTRFKINRRKLLKEAITKFLSLDSTDVQDIKE